MKRSSVFASLVLLITFIFACQPVGVESIPENVFVIHKNDIKTKLHNDFLKVTIPMEKKNVGPVKGTILMEIINLEDETVAQKEEKLNFVQKTKDMTMDIPLGDIPSHELSLHRLKYTLTTDLGFLSDIRRLDDTGVGITIMGQSDFLAETIGGFRIVVYDYENDTPLKDATVKCILMGSQILFSSNTNAQGTVDAIFEVPDVYEDTYPLKVVVSSQKGDETFTRDIRIYRSCKVLLTTDKPLYQPNQTMHIRSLSLFDGTQKSVAGSPIIIEVEDAKGNKVFKEKSYTDNFGVASADFKLADQINMGNYKIRAIQGRWDERSRGMRERMDLPLGEAEKTVRVEEYVLPKFKINITTDKDWYMPGETMKGQIQADYFFGKPVAESDISLDFYQFVIDFDQFESVATKTDKNGHANFEIDLPANFYGQPFEQGKAMIRIDATVIDNADQEVMQTITRSVVQKSFVMNALFESGNYVPGIEQDFYIVVANPDGTPGKNVKVQIGRFKTTTNDLGIAIMPSSELPKSPGFTIMLSDEAGNRADFEFNINHMTEADNAILLKTDKSVADVGDQINLQFFTPQKRFTAYLDVIKNNQTILTKAIDLEAKAAGSTAKMDLEITPDMTGVLGLNAYIIMENSQIVRDTRLIYINEANDLNITIKPGQDSYLPGSDGKIDFTVKDGQGKGVVAAIGVQIVDEAVFALSEQQPGLAKVYFRLEEELMQPRYEIHSMQPKDLVMHPIESGQREKAAAVLLASIDFMPEYTINVDTYKERRENYRKAFVEKVQTDADHIAEKLADLDEINWGENDSLYIESLIRKGKLTKEDVTDPWGNRYHIIFESEVQLLIVSDGPDEIAKTDDDIGLQAYIYKGRNERGLQLDGVFGGRGANKGMPRPEAVMFEKMEVADMAPAPSPVEEKEGGSSEPRTRKWFPETLYNNPVVITDKNGKATINLKIADNITDWRITTMANSQDGQLGSNTGNLLVFQEFFVDLNLPVSLTQNDQVSIPVAIYNYLPEAQTVTLEFQKEDWFDLISDAKTSLKLEKDEVTVRYFTIKVKELGNHTLTITARGSSMSDKIQKNIEVMPDGKAKFVTISDRLTKSVEKEVFIPEGSIDGSAKLLVKIYPGMFSQVVEGLDAMLQMPFGCFEQTSATTYPNVLVLNYMKETRKITPEIQMKAEEYINVGYQRLLSYEVSGGGFEWFGNDPAHTFLTAFGLMEFYDMSKVHPVDPVVINRTQNWLVSQQESDGSWMPISRYLDSAAQRFTDDQLRATAYVLWSLVETGYTGSPVDRAKTYVRSNIKDTDDPYTIAVAANAMLNIDKNADLTFELFKKLVDIKIDDGDDVCYWSSDGSLSPSKGKTADLETTALAAYGLIKYGKYPKETEKALNYLIKSKDQFGNWYNTQATVLSLKALLASLTESMVDANATIKISGNNGETTTIKVNEENADVMHQIDLTPFVKEGKNLVNLDMTGEGNLMYQIVGKYYVPWKEADIAANEILNIEVDYDKTTLEKDDTVTCTAKITNNTNAILDMVVVDLGIPPGFTVHSGDLINLVEKKIIQKYSLTGRQIIIYFDKIDEKAKVDLEYGLTADFPIKAKTTKSRAYLYYEPEKEAFAQPVEMVVEE